MEMVMKNPFSEKWTNNERHLRPYQYNFLLVMKCSDCGVRRQIAELTNRKPADVIRGLTEHQSGHEVHWALSHLSQVNWQK